MTEPNLLEVTDLKMHFHTRDGIVNHLDMAFNQIYWMVENDWYADSAPS